MPRPVPIKPTKYRFVCNCCSLNVTKYSEPNVDPRVTPTTPPTYVCSPCYNTIMKSGNVTKQDDSDDAYDRAMGIL